MARATILRLVFLACSLLVSPNAWAADEGSCLREWGIRAGGGINRSSQIQYYALHPYVGLPLWTRADRWLAERNIEGLWIIEPWFAFVSDQHGKHKTDSFEIGVSPFFARLTFGSAVFRPFIEGGEGITYTDLRKQDYGTRIQFTSQIGVGIEYRLRPDLALTLGGRFRHLSNAGLASTNPGVNTIYGLLGVTFR